jgi:hypothetical protein
MKLALAVLCAAVAALGVGAGLASADNPGEWDVSVAAMQSVDPTIPVPGYDPSRVLAVGGGTVAGSSNLGLGGPNFAFGATLTPSGAQGAMTVVGTIPGVTLHAQVTCVVAASLPGGGAIATVIGHLTQPDLGPDEQLIFILTDGGEPDGAGDMWGSTVTNGVPCGVPLPGGQPIVGNITIHVP